MDLFPPRARLALSIVAAAAIVVLPLLAGQTRPVYARLSYAQLMALSFGMASLGWVGQEVVTRTGRPRRVTALLVAFVVITCLAANWRLARHQVLSTTTVADIAAIAFLVGAAVRGLAPGRRPPEALVAVAALASWTAIDVPQLLDHPLRDLHSYLVAGTAAASGATPYLTAPLTSMPPFDANPFVYPPWAILPFAALSQLPVQLVEVGWVSLSLAAVMLSLRLLGLRGRWLFLFVAWPPLAQGIQVGNVVVFGFLALAAGYRAVWALVLGGAFKFQTAVPALWGVRERRFRELATGAAVLGAFALVAALAYGPGVYADWLHGLGYFQTTVDQLPPLRGTAVSTFLPGPWPLIVAGVAIAVALLRGGRNGLARLGVASIVASPTIYLHGFATLLPGALSLPPLLLWFTLGIMPWYAWGTRVWGSWVALAVVSASLLLSRRAGLSAPEWMTPDLADVHPIEAGGHVWPLPRHDATADRRAAERSTDGSAVDAGDAVEPALVSMPASVAIPHEVLAVAPVGEDPMPPGRRESLPRNRDGYLGAIVGRVTRR